MAEANFEEEQEHELETRLGDESVPHLQSPPVVAHAEEELAHGRGEVGVEVREVLAGSLGESWTDSREVGNTRKQVHTEQVQEGQFRVGVVHWSRLLASASPKRGPRGRDSAGDPLLDQMRNTLRMSFEFDWLRNSSMKWLRSTLASSFWRYSSKFAWGSANQSRNVSVAFWYFFLVEWNWSRF